MGYNLTGNNRLDNEMTKAAKFADDLINNYLHDAVINIRANTPQGILDSIDEEMGKAKKPIQAIITMAGKNTLDSVIKVDGKDVKVADAISGIQLQTNKNLILNIENKDSQNRPLHISVPAMYNLALSIGFGQDITGLLASIGIAVSADPGKPVRS
jgi:hypothetical protein